MSEITPRRRTRSSLLPRIVATAIFLFGLSASTPTASVAEPVGEQS